MPDERRDADAEHYYDPGEYQVVGHPNREQDALDVLEARRSEHQPGREVSHTPEAAQLELHREDAAGRNGRAITGAQLALEQRVATLLDREKCPRNRLNTAFCRLSTAVVAAHDGSEHRPRLDKRRRKWIGDESAGAQSSDHFLFLHLLDAGQRREAIGNRVPQNVRQGREHRARPLDDRTELAAAAVQLANARDDDSLTEHERR